MQNVWRQTCELGRFLRSRMFSASLMLVLLAVMVCTISDMTYVVVRIDDPQRTLSYAMRSLPVMGREAARQNGKEPSVPPEGPLQEVNEEKTMQAVVCVDGAETAHDVPIGTTVGELLHTNGVAYDGNDLLSPPADKPISDGEEIVLQRVVYQQYTEQVTLPFETIEKQSPLVRVGQIKRVQEGREGVKQVSYVQRTVDGKQEEVQVLGEQMLRYPQTETVLIGSRQAVSPLDFGIELDANGKPVHYKRVLTNQIATGYSARAGARTASGRYAITGHVAVNPEVIPYGSKLYVTSADGKFVYGCAIAADTGTGLLQGIVDIDLFYDTYIESAMNGRKILDIYILE